MRLTVPELDRGEAPSEGPGPGSTLEPVSRLAAVEKAFGAATERGLAHLDAEDERFDGRIITVRGRRLVNFGSCSYLGLEVDARLKAGAGEAVARYGVQFSSSRAYVSAPPYRELEGLLGAIFGAPLVVAQTTSLAHFAALPVLIGAGDAVLCDHLVHSSVQAVLPTLRAAGAACKLVRHGRLDRLADAVESLASKHPRVWYLGDGVYSMHGDTAPMDDLRALAARHPQLHLYLDDAHGLSWTGRHGRGHVLGDAPIPPRTVVAASLAKGFGAGGAVLLFSDARAARLVRTCGSTMIFSGPLQPPLLGAGVASARIHLSPELDELQRRLRERIQLFNAEARARGLPLGSTEETPIRFVEVGSDAATCEVATALVRDGFFLNTALFPAVSAGRGGLRLTLTVHQTLRDVRELAAAIARRI